MEIKEIISYYVDSENEILEVSFRLADDEEDYVRTDEIDLSETVDFAYALDTTKNEFNLIEEEEEEVFDYEEVEFEDEQIILFLNEYYTVYPNRLPKSEIF